MKPETQAKLWTFIREWRDAEPGNEAFEAARPIDAILSRHVEQPAETEEQAAERIRQAERDGALRALEALSRDPGRSIGEQRRLDDLHTRITRGEWP